MEKLGKLHFEGRVRVVDRNEGLGVFVPEGDVEGEFVEEDVVETGEDGEMFLEIRGGWGGYGEDEGVELFNELGGLEEFVVVGLFGEVVAEVGEIALGNCHVNSIKKYLFLT